jgi:hypothetical protein
MFPRKNTKNNKTHLRNSLEIYEDQRSIKTVNRYLSFLATIFNRSDERKSIKMNPKSGKKKKKKKKVISQQGNIIKSN